MGRRRVVHPCLPWIPAFAGMTGLAGLARPTGVTGIKRGTSSRATVLAGACGRDGNHQFSWQSDDECVYLPSL